MSPIHPYPTMATQKKEDIFCACISFICIFGEIKNGNMETNELRIGNLIYDCTNATGSCNEAVVTWEYLRAIEEDWSDCKPIPLTEEWLLKLGFEYSALYENYRIAYHSEFTFFNSVRIRYGKFFYSNDYSDADCYVIRDIEYVHQLQNLHFALTGEELEIK